MKTDTIAAIATAMSDAGIGIIRISGEESIEIADRIFVKKGGHKKLKDVDSHTIHYGHIVDNSSDRSETNNQNIVDEVLISVFKKPHSYTMEDTVEINCHGGVLMMHKILELVIRAGARMATPGEFTKRAFLNGRLDLSEAEAVIDIIHSQNEYALQNSVKQLKGSLSEKVRTMREELIYEIAFIESALDDPEHISLEGYPEKLQEKIDKLLKQVNLLLTSSENGKIIKEGISTVIVGKPNAGKSSLLNLLAGEDRAIVTEVAGTTRDILEERIRIGDFSLRVIDTAGIREAEDVVEKIGVEKAKKYAKDADLILYVVDSSIPLDQNDRDIIEMIGSKKCIVLLNKNDLESAVTVTELEGLLPDGSRIIKTSTKENQGMDLFEEAIKDMFFQNEIAIRGEVLITNMRHKEALLDTKESLLQVNHSLENQMPEDFYSIDLMSAYASLGTIIGEEVGEDLVDEIFTKFCMGK